jgi:hypothetical protein
VEDACSYADKPNEKQLNFDYKLVPLPVDLPLLPLLPSQVVSAANLLEAHLLMVHRLQPMDFSLIMNFTNPLKVTRDFINSVHIHQLASQRQVIAQQLENMQRFCKHQHPVYCWIGR